MKLLQHKHMNYEEFVEFLNSCKESDGWIRDLTISDCGFYDLPQIPIFTVTTIEVEKKFLWLFSYYGKKDISLIYNIPISGGLIINNVFDFKKI